MSASVMSLFSRLVNGASTGPAIAGPLSPREVSTWDRTGGCEDARRSETPRIASAPDHWSSIRTTLGALSRRRRVSQRALRQAKGSACTNSLEHPTNQRAITHVHGSAGEVSRNGVFAVLEPWLRPQHWCCRRWWKRSCEGDLAHRGVGGKIARGNSPASGNRGARAWPKAHSGGDPWSAKGS